MSASCTKSRSVAPWIAGSAGSIFALLIGTGREAVAVAVVTPQNLGALTLSVWPGQLDTAANNRSPATPEVRDGELVVVPASLVSAGASIRLSQQFVMRRSGLSWPLMALIPRTWRWQQVAVPVDMFDMPLLATAEEVRPGAGAAQSEEPCCLPSDG